MDHLAQPASHYLGRIKFGDGQINAEGISEEQFTQQLEFIKDNSMMFAADLRQLHGACMDGRGDVKTDRGNAVEPRPKVIGGPSLYGWYLASIGQFSIIDGIDKPLEQFTVVNERLKAAGIFLGMHHACGAARGILPITEKYFNNFGDIHELAGSKARLMAELKNGRYLSEIKEGISRTHDIAEKAGADFDEPKMLQVVRSIDSGDPVVHLDVDHDHPTHGHEEGGLVFMRIKHAILDKNSINKMTGQPIFYNNSLYAKMIAEAIAQQPDELAKAIIIGDQLPIAGVATLGQGQHVGELTGNYLVAA